MGIFQKWFSSFIIKEKKMSTVSDDLNQALQTASAEVAKLTSELQALPAEIAALDAELWAKIKAFLGVA